ncbi:MAG TPA: hypothetical protein VEW04_02995 [Allosphingosinicella sp.]|nr:hypothetical protein [Allosphingosinicella sp.]
MRFGWIIALAFCLGAAPAAADITARYRQAVEGQGDLMVQVSSRGESRMTVAEATYITRDGVTYMALTDGTGSFVVRQQDFLALMADLLRATGEPAPPANAARVTISEAGAESVGGRPGRLFRIGNPAIPSDMFEVVISDDAGLAPLRGVMLAHLAPFFDTMGRSSPGLAEALRDLLGRGALLRLGPLFQLESIDTAPVPSSAFELASPPISHETLAERLQAQAHH